MAKKTFTIFDSASSPQVGGDSVGAGDGKGVWLRVKDARVVNTGSFDITEEAVLLIVTGTFNSATIKVALANEQTSPMVYAYAFQPQDAGTSVVNTITEAGAYKINVPSGTYFTLEISGSGSPIPAIVATARGEIEAA